MTAPQLGAFAAWIFTIVVVPLAILCGVPLIARLRFVHKVEVLRDTCSDALLDEEMPSSPAAEKFLALSEWLSENAKLLTLPRALTMHLTLVQFEISGDDENELEFSNEPLMEELKGRLQGALVTYFLNGSPLGWPFAALLWLGRHFGKKLPIKGGEKKKVPVPSVPTLAQETVTSVLDKDFERVLLGVG